MSKKYGSKNFFGETPLTLFDRKHVSLLYLSIGTEWRTKTSNTKMSPRQHMWSQDAQIVGNFRNSLHPTPQDNIFCFFLWPENTETFEQFYSTLKELTKKCKFENREEDIKRDIFITKCWTVIYNANSCLIQWNLKELSALQSAWEWDFKIINNIPLTK